MSGRSPDEIQVHRQELAADAEAEAKVCHVVLEERVHATEAGYTAVCNPAWKGDRRMTEHCKAALHNLGLQSLGPHSLGLHNLAAAQNPDLWGAERGVPRLGSSRSSRRQLPHPDHSLSPPRHRS
eukprot:TRINITY_DN12469_c0_g1_i10.p2 TRINITY_DN12469_c0_g1~~TRINITY_DN12469_c0_g1_i10.p2  ORF type:complete len:125 (+),score=0.79 TRINITY_DN12469_c0_g1_i10:979-1353(+)